MAYETVIYKKEGGIATLTLNRPDRRNAYNMQMLGELESALADVARDGDIRVLVLTGAGGAFCSGADFRYREVREGRIPLEEAEELRPIIEGIGRGQPVNEVVRFLLGLQRLDKPTIAMVGGDAVGAGFDFALACDMRIGSSKARFMVAYTRIGLASDTGTTWLLPRVVGLPKALELMFTGDFVNAEEAEKLGLLNRLVPEDRLEAETMELARKLAQGPPIAHRLTKLQVYKGLEYDFETALSLAMSVVHIGISSQDHQEGIRAFIEKRPPVFRDR
jgi:enoyl-CoA hydratase/carnithine racemase